MAGKPKRLSKVTKEFNLGLTTVVDYLQEKGFEVESNPNAKISPRCMMPFSRVPNGKKENPIKLRLKSQ